MARYEHAGRFWAIAREGSVLTITSGKLGNKGRTVTKHHANADAALAAHDKLVLEKQREGYRLAASEPVVEAVAPIIDPTDDRGRRIEADLALDPDDEAAYTIYSDWLQRHGDPRGELIALQQQGAKPAVIGKHVATHAAHFLGPLAPLVPDVRVVDAPPFFWKHGFIRRAELASGKSHALGTVVEQLLAHPSGRLLVELALRADDRDDALAALSAAADDTRPSLRELDLYARADLGRIDRQLWSSFPKLERLSITARRYELVALAMPTLRRARFYASSLSSATVEAVAAAPFPLLQRLELRFCGSTGSCEADFHDLRPLLLRTDIPALTHLRVRGCPFAGAVARTLATSPLARQLELLDFSHGDFTPMDVATLAKHATSFPNLRELWMPSGIDLAPLAAVAKRVVPDTRGPVDALDFELAAEPQRASTTR